MNQPKSPELTAILLRAAALGRREYAASQPEGARAADLMKVQAKVLDEAALLVEGDLSPLWNWLPSWRHDEVKAGIARAEGTGL